MLSPILSLQVRIVFVIPIGLAWSWDRLVSQCLGGMWHVSVIFCVVCLCESARVPSLRESGYPTLMTFRIWEWEPGKHASRLHSCHPSH